MGEAKDKYKAASDIIYRNDQIKNRDSLIAAITSKINALDSDSDLLEHEPESPELSEKAQDLIKNLFSFSEKKDKDEAVLEGAIALAKFGQFDRAIKEFNDLLDKDSQRVVAAKNVLRCYVAMAAYDDAIAQYEKWKESGQFPPEQLEAVRSYLSEYLNKKGIKSQLSMPDTVPGAAETADLAGHSGGGDEETEFLDITSVGITLDTGPDKGKMVEFDVNFQSGNMLSLIISSKDKALIEGLQTGIKLSNIQYYSPIAIFKGSGIVAARTEISNGPKKGDFCLDIKIVNQ